MRLFSRHALGMLLIAFVIIAKILVNSAHKPNMYLTKSAPPSASESSSSLGASANATVKRVVDGDTLVIDMDSGEEKVRLIGVDTPESKKNKKAEKDSSRSGQSLDAIVALGKRAAAFTKELVPPGTEVVIETDVQGRDKYGRLLVYVYLPDGRMVNMVIIAEGYASTMTIPPNVKHAEEFLKAERSARAQNKGLWAVE
jgi:micrococcal nuclease